MRFNESARSIASPSTFALRPGDRGDTHLNDDSVAPEIAFLSSYNVPVDRLIAASRLARQQQVSADQFVLAEGLVDERYFYRCLAHRLGLRFIEEPVRLMDVGALYPQVILKGLVPYESANGHAWLGAPSGKSILTLLRMSEGGNGLSCLTIATPSNLSLWVRERMRHRVTADASFGLLSANSNHCAREGSNFAQKVFASIVACVFALTFLSSELSLARQMIIGLIFFIAIVFRLVVAVKAIRLTHPRRKPLEDYQLPPYTVLVALRSEARVVRRLVRNLDRLNYPRTKLEIKIIIEEEDADTLSALKALPLAPIYEIIVAPEGYPRTKPRALNVALPLARGELIAVFDAEDEPDPDQLRRAAEEFAASPSKLACLQAKLEIDNLDDSWLTRGILAQTPQEKIAMLHI